MTTQNFTVLLTFLALVAVAPCASATTLIDVEDVRLTPKSAQALATIACPTIGAHVESLAAYRASGEPVQATVVCATPERMEGLPALHQVACRSERRTWKCDSAEIHVVVDAQDHPTRLRVADQRAVASGVAVLRYLRTVKSFDSRAVEFRVRDAWCEVTMTEPGLWRGSCNGLGFAVAEDCRQSKCAYRLVELARDEDVIP